VKAVLCPFCGAPYREFIPTNALQLECQYCGGVFLVPPEIGGIPQCSYHIDRLSIGICNDCGKNFCGECLHVYNLETKGANAILYLCSACLKRRHVKNANGFIYVGFMLLLSGALYSLFVIPIGILFLLLGCGAVIYGFSKRSATLEEFTIDELNLQREKRKTELAEMEGADVEELYSELLTRYINHWGLATGTELLDSEIGAYTRHGVSFSEAVKKIYQRQQSKHS